jgi:hypothetical protein
VWVGFYNTATGTATVLQLRRDVLVNTTSGVIAPGVFYAAAYTKSAVGAIWGSTAVPTGIAMDARLDASCDTTSFPVVCNTWAIRLRVPTSAAAGGIDLGSTFGMWNELDVENGNNGTIAQAKWPVGAATVDETTFPLTFPEPTGSTSPASAPWFTVSASGGTCAPGISLQAGDVSVTSALGAGTVIDLSSTNTFHVKPLNSTVTPYNPNAIQARLRIADWGTGVGDAPKWVDVPDPSCQSAVETATGVVATNARFDLTCSWKLTAGQRCAYRPDLFPGCTPNPGPRYSQQCILVELSSTAVSIPFSSSSACGSFTFSQSVATQ